MCEGLGKCMVTEACNSYSINGTKSTGLVVAPNPTAKHFADGKQISAWPNQFPVHKWQTSTTD
jgi:hypothetical protein